MTTNTSDRLADAAPAMLAALERVEAEAEALIGEDNWYASGRQAAALMECVRDAIAKAKAATP